jgi:CRISPR-associated protein Csb2
VLTIGIRYLTGYSAATDLARDAAEWPPHPGRLFMALAASYFENRGGAAERAALEWLETQAAPDVYASEANERTKVEAYVPVNDKSGDGTTRSKQLRAFRKTRPAEDTVYFRWQMEPEKELREALGTVCESVTRIGYSASLTQVWVELGNSPEANWLPSDGWNDIRMRIPVAGTLASLERSYRGEEREEYATLIAALASAPKSAQASLRKKLKERFPQGSPDPERPSLSVWQGYTRSAEAGRPGPTTSGPFAAEFLVLAKIDGPALGLESTQQLTGALRNAAMKSVGGEPPEWLTGHQEDGSPTKLIHAAFFPLAYIGGKYGDGHVMGLGIALPRDLETSARGRQEIRRRLGPLFFEADGTERKVRLWSEPGQWEWTLERHGVENGAQTLRRERWTGPSRTWASVTPVVLPRHAKKREGHAEQIVAAAVESAGYPALESIELNASSMVAGAPTAWEMPKYEQGGQNMCRYQVHAVIRFREPVTGPVLIGRGRFRGYGLFLPLEDETR